ncbi:hypothetical protein [Flavobacterium aciduliphilum]|uniref:Uncharacterized protein n=1 Tax=Flavobacterium aciduliphilum TaxID=1101402 RepID=A0A328YN74_9FLAO|nr:hypothetical protein [Flavobacterium aciduliphilum]RAR74285.1 hypothetical protein CLV55_102219 [Flavobacterium aciduliphilum]
MDKKKIVIISLSVFVLLLVPLLAMWFTDELDWDGFDFLVAGIVLFLIGIGIDFLLSKVKSMKKKLLLGIILFLVVFLIWVELAIGVFGTPFSGS